MVWLWCVVICINNSKAQHYQLIYYHIGDLGKSDPHWIYKHFENLIFCCCNTEMIAWSDIIFVNFTQALLVVLVTNIMSVHDPKLHKSSVYFILPQERDWQSLCPYSFTVREEHSIHFFPVYFRAEEVELILILSIKWSNQKPKDQQSANRRCTPINVGPYLSMSIFTS